MEELLLAAGLAYLGASAVAYLAPHTRAGRLARHFALDLRALLAHVEPPPPEPESPRDEPPKA